MKQVKRKPLCQLDDLSLPGCKGFELGDMSFFIVNSETGLFAYKNQCPHRNIPLNWADDRFLDPDQELIQCSNHNALFDIASGHCVAGPCVNLRLEALSIEVNDGYVFVLLE